MGNVSRGRRLLLILLGLYLGAVAWVYVRYPVRDTGPAVIQLGLWGVLPIGLALLAGLGTSWARRGLAVVWGLRAVLDFMLAQQVAAALDKQKGVVTLEDAVTPAVLSVLCMLAAIVVLVQKDIREMTRPR